MRLKQKHIQKAVIFFSAMLMCAAFCYAPVLAGETQADETSIYIIDEDIVEEVYKSEDTELPYSDPEDVLLPDDDGYQQDMPSEHEDPLIFEEEISLPEETAVTDDGYPDPAAPDAFTGDASGLIIDLPSDEYVQESGSDENTVLEFLPEEDMTEEAELSDPTMVSPDTNLVSRRGILKAVKAADAYPGSFGEELDEAGRYLYQRRYQHFGYEFSNAQLEISWSSRDQALFSFKTAGKRNEEGKWQIDKTSDQYHAGYENVLFELQASFDALFYDHPEIYWFRSTSVKVRYGSSVLVNQQTDEGTIWVASITITSNEAFDGAYELRDEFFAGVDEAVERIRRSCDYNLDGTLSDMEVVQGIHDYVCNRSTYDRSSLNAYLSTYDKKYASIFTPAGIFTDQVSSGIVCEGYGRALKILCDRFSIPCVMIAGKASASASIGHLWNAVMIDGIWYLVDATWDDTGDPALPNHSYFLCGTSKVPDRISSGLLSGEETTDSYGYVHRRLNFIYPVITDHMHIFEEVSPEAVACTGYHAYVCEQDGIGYFTPDEEIQAAGHAFDDSGICTVCGMIGNGQETETEIVIEPETVLVDPEPETELQTETEPHIEPQLPSEDELSQDELSDQEPQSHPSGQTSDSGKSSQTDETSAKIQKQVSVKKSKITALRTAGSRKVKISWKKVKSSDGYQLQYGRKRSMKGARKKTIKKASRTGLTLKKLKRGKRYYFRIRTWKKVNGSIVYSKWSARKSIIVR